MSQQPITKTPAVYAAIVKVQEALSREGIAKERDNVTQHFKFRGIDDVYNALAPHLAAAGLCILPCVLERSTSERPSKSGGTLTCVVVKVEYTFIAAADGSSHRITVYGEAMDSADKGTNKALSAAYKYACFQAFCIPTEGDDADAHSPQPAATPVAKPAETLLATIERWDQTLAERKVSNPGALVAHLCAHLKPQHGGDMSKWPESLRGQAGDLTADFNRARHADIRNTLFALLESKGQSEAKLLAALKLPADADARSLTAAQMNDAIARLKVLPDVVRS